MSIEVWNFDLFLWLPIEPLPLSSSEHQKQKLCKHAKNTISLQETIYHRISTELHNMLTCFSHNFGSSQCLQSVWVRQRHRYIDWPQWSNIKNNFIGLAFLNILEMKKQNHKMNCNKKNIYNKYEYWKIYHRKMWELYHLCD